MVTFFARPLGLLGFEDESPVKKLSPEEEGIYCPRPRPSRPALSSLLPRPSEPPLRELVTSPPDGAFPAEFKDSDEALATSSEALGLNDFGGIIN